MPNLFKQAEIVILDGPAPTTTTLTSPLERLTEINLVTTWEFQHQTKIVVLCWFSIIQYKVTK